MKTVVQRVGHARLTVDGEVVGEIGEGLVVFLGVEKGDPSEDIVYLADKLPKLRIFADDCGKTNKSLEDVGGEILVVSQFTLCGKCGKGHGNRPDFGNAECAQRARELYEKLILLLRNRGVSVATGVFGAHMLIDQQNVGPFTIIM